MKTPFLLAAFFATSASVFSQIEWQKNYGQPPADEHLFWAESGADASHFWAVGALSLGPQTDLFFAKIDATGDIVFADTLGDAISSETFFGYSRSAETGEHWILGNSWAPSNQSGGEKGLFLAKFDAAGALLFLSWQKLDFLPTAGNHQYSIEADGDGLFLFDLYQKDLFRLNSAGEKVWHRDLGLFGWASSTGVAAAGGGESFALDGFSVDSFFVHRLAADGSTIWRRKIQDDSTTARTRVFGLAADRSEKAVFAFHHAAQVAFKGNKISKFDSTGQLVWQRGLEIQSQIGASSGFFTTPAGDIALISSRGFELRRGSTGDLLAQKKWAGDGLNFSGGAMLDDTTAAIVGDFQESFWHSLDGWATVFSLPSFEILAESRIGQPGFLPDDDRPRVLAASDGGAFLGWIGAAGFSKTDFFVQKTAENGQPIWQKRVGTDSLETVFELAEMPDGSLLIGGKTDENEQFTLDDRLFLARLAAADGSLIWKKTMPRRGLLHRPALVPMADGGAIALFHSQKMDTSGAFLSAQQAIRLGSAGDSVWSAMPFGFESGLFEGGLDLADGSFLAWGQKAGAAILARLKSSDGSLIWLSKIAADPSMMSNPAIISAVREPSGEIVALGRGGGAADESVLFRVSQNGLILDRKPMEKSDSEARLARSNDGGLFVVFKEFNSNSSATARKIGSDLASVGEKTWTGLPPFWQPRLAGDGSVFLSGRFAVGLTYDVFLAKTEPSGLVATDFLAAKNGLFEISPNPLGPSDCLKFELEDAAFFGPFSIQIFTLDGRLFSIFEMEKTGVQQLFEIEKGLPSGPFFIRLLTEKGAGQKLVLRY